MAALLAASAAGAETVRLQLKWRHQFQFAGYYAAQAKGYYAAEGLDVSILEGGVERPPLATVLGGGAEFGVGDAEVLLARLKGAPIVVCAAIFQHSPYVLLSRHDRGIRTPADLVGARVMLSDDQGAAQVRAMLVHEGIDPGSVTILAQTWDLDALIDRRVDAMSAYATVEPALLRARGVEPGLLRALDYGVDFYGDTLFTTEETLNRHPERVAAFRRASLKGWEYALQHGDELAQLISEKPGVSARGVTRATLAHEAAAMRPFILPDVVEVGHMNPGRWQRIAETFVEAGLAPSTERVGGLVYDPHPASDHAQMRRVVWGAVGVLAVTGAVLVWNVQMRRNVRDRTRQLQEEVVQRRHAEAALRASEERFRAMFAGAAAGITVTALDGRFVYANPAFCAMLGYDEAELRSRDIGSVTHPDDRAASAEARQRLLRGETSTLVFEKRYLRGSGESVWVRAIVALLRDPDGAPTQFVTTTEDITERTHADALLEGQRRVLEMIALNAPLTGTLEALLRVVETRSPELVSSILLLDRDGLHVRHGAALRLSETFIRGIDGAPIGEWAGSSGAAAHRGEPVIVDDIATSPLWNDYRELAAAEGLRAGWSTPIFDSQRRVLGTFALYLDHPGRPTDEHLRLIDLASHMAAIAIGRTREEQALRESEERYRSLFESAPDGILVADMDGRYVDANPSALNMLGHTREQLVGMGSADVLAETELPHVESALADLVQGLEHRREWLFRRRDGSQFPADVIAKAVTGGRILALVRDASELRRAEAALRESQKRLLSIYDTVGDVIFLVALEPDGGFRFESVNQRFVATTGLPVDAVVGKRVEEVIPAASLPLVLGRYREAVEARAVVRWEETTDYPPGRITGEVSVAPIVDAAGRCTHLVGAVHDVTARKLAEERQAQAEQMLRQSQKLEGIGRLAGGIAHDFNNIVGVILGYGDLMRRHLDDGHPARSRLEQVIQAAERAAGLTRQLLAFSRKQVMQPKLIDLAVLVGDMRRMLDRLLGEDIEIAVLGAERPGIVLADPTQVEQVVMNLVVNARDAMPRGGHLTIETANVDFDETYASEHPPALPGPFVMLAVSDTGVGMNADTRRQVFEPFFTTKPVGEGTGLGLATVYGIVKQMGGYIWVYSEVDHGTSFKVYLPRVEEAPVATVASGPPPPPARGRETLLVVEDSESLRNMIRELLADLGYTVLTATEGEEALALIEGGLRPIDLVLTDVVMPKLGGAELVKRLRASHPRLRVVYMSGYASGAVSRHGEFEEGAVLLEKPFTAEMLARTVRTALDGQAARG